MAKQNKMTDDELISLIDQDVTDALGYDDAISTQREKALEYYYGLPAGPSSVQTKEALRPGTLQFFNPDSGARNSLKMLNNLVDHFCLFTNGNPDSCGAPSNGAQKTEPDCP